MATQSKRVEASKPSNKNKGFSHLSFPVTHNAHSILFVFKEYKYADLANGIKLGETRENNFANNPSRQAATKAVADTMSVQLPFPKQLSDQTSLRINGFERSPMVAAAAEKFSSMAGSLGDKKLSDMLSEVTGGLNQIGSDLANISVKDQISKVFNGTGSIEGNQMAAAARYFMQQLPGDVGRSIDAAFGTVVNPKETLAFEGVNLKSHQFNWSLYPDNQADSDRIREIVRRIKKLILPQTDELFGVEKVFLKYPAMVDIYLIGVNKEHFMKFKTCMVTDLTVDYGAAGAVSIMKGGKPAGVNLSMSLQELEIHTADDYSEGNSSDSAATATSSNPEQE